MIDGSYRNGHVFHRVLEKNNFTKENFEVISEMLQCENLSSKYKSALLSLLSAYCKGLYCDDCKGSLRTSSTSGVCEWNHDMPVDLPLNDGPPMRYPSDCPIRKLTKGSLPNSGRNSK